MKKNLSIWLPLLAMFAMIVTVAWISTLVPTVEPEVSIPYSSFKQQVNEANVAAVTFRDAELRIELVRAIKQDNVETTRAKTILPSIGDPTLLPLLEERKVKINSRASTAVLDNWWSWMIPILFVLLLYGVLWRPMLSSMGGRFGGGMGAGDFLTGSAKEEVEKKGPKVTFEDVAGQENAKAEVAELVDLLRDREKYTRLGAEAPHGILLMGPPGTGKTLLARALAGEAGVPFFNISASEFIELYVGVGASRVRSMFNEAKSRAPSIIFIDELDSVGRVRGTGLGGGHDEREQTLNQILAEMDGFSGHEAVIVLAATNRPDVLDPALLRPGRFDRHVTLELPDRKAREQILEVHVRKVPLAKDVDLSKIAATTPGFSGADLKNLVNEAAMSAARKGLNCVTMQQLDEMRDKVIMGSVRTLAIPADEKHRLAVHEAGHTVVAYFLPNADPLYKVTIIPRGRTLGGTHMLPFEERHTLPEDYLKDQLSVLLAGRTAEVEFLGTPSSGADDDIARATQLARAMVARWGMSEDVGPMDLRQSDEHPFLGREIAQPRRFAEQTAHLVDRAVKTLLEEAEARALEVLRTHRVRASKLIDELEAQETLSHENIRSCLGPAREQTGGLSNLVALRDVQDPQT